MAKKTPTTPTPESVLPSQIAQALADLIGENAVIFGAGKGETREEFSKSLVDFTPAQARKAFLYGCQQVFNDWRSPLLSGVKAGTKTLPEGVKEDDTEALFDYWWSNRFGQATIRESGSGTLVASIEAQAIQEYLNKKLALPKGTNKKNPFRDLWFKLWTTDELTPKGKPKAKPRPSTIDGLHIALNTLVGGQVSDSKWLEVKADIQARMTRIEEEQDRGIPENEAPTSNPESYL